MDVKHKKCKRNKIKKQAKPKQNETLKFFFILFLFLISYIFESSKEIFTEKQKQNNKKTNKQ